MTLITTFSFILAMLILALSPGPGVFMIVSKAITNGFKTSLYVIAGLILGDIIYLLLALYGLNTLAIFLGEFFIYIKIIGAFYLFYLAYKIYTSKIEDFKLLKEEKINKLSNFTHGLFITLANPKVIVFYLGFLPAFIDLQNLNVNDLFLLLFIVSFCLASVLSFYAFMAHKSKELINNTKNLKILNTITSFLMASAASVLLIKE